jgi:hypothetical protein
MLYSIFKLNHSLQMAKIPKTDQSQNRSKNYKSEKPMGQHEIWTYRKLDQMPRSTDTESEYGVGTHEDI